jgi:hypothetical protein
MSEEIKRKVNRSQIVFRAFINPLRFSVSYQTGVKTPSTKTVMRTPATCMSPIVAPRSAFVIFNVRLEAVNCSSRCLLPDSDHEGIGIRPCSLFRLSCRCNGSVTFLYMDIAVKSQLNSVIMDAVVDRRSLRWLENWDKCIELTAMSLLELLILRR